MVEQRGVKGISSSIGKIFTNSNTTMLKTNMQKYAMLFDGTYKSAGLDFLLNYSDTRLVDAISISIFNEMNYAAEISSRRQKEEILDEKTLFLSSPEKNKAKLDDMLAIRHSARYFDNNYVVTFKVFSSIMKKTFGISDTRFYNINGIKTPCRNYGSGGGLYPINVIVLVKRVEKIKDGFYRYQPYSNSLYPMNCNADFQDLIIGTSFDFNSINFGIFYEYTLSRNYIKYGELGIMAALIEVGLMSQTFELVANSFGLQCCQIAGIQKKIIQKLLSIDGINNHILMLNICGKEEK